MTPDWLQKFRDAYRQEYNGILSDEVIDKGNKWFEEFIAQIHAESYEAGRQNGADIAMAVKLSSFDQYKTYITALAQDLLPIQNEQKHNQAVLKLSNIGIKK